MKARLASMTVIAAMAIVLWALPAVAQEDNRFVDARVDEIKNPVSWFHWGFDQRIREIYAPNIMTLSKEPEENRWHFGRYRSRLDTQIDLADGIQFDTRLVWEWRYWDNPWAPGTAVHKDASVNFDEALFDRMNLKFRNAFGAPLDITVGRQDIIMGNGWLVLDGTPLDGSRTIFFDAARFTYRLEDSKTNIDLIYIDQRAEANKTIRPFNDQDRRLMEQDEIGIIFNVSTQSLVPDATTDGFFIWKKDMPLDPAVRIIESSDLYTLGARIDGAMDANWRYRAEGAGQWGVKNDMDHCAFGANSQLSYLFNDALNTKLHTGYEYLSGDSDPADGRSKAFDPLWGRWPQWSELYVYTYARESWIGETTNLHRFFVGADFQPHRVLGVEAKYHLLFADKDSDAVNAAFFNDGHKFRGQLATMWLKYKINRFVSGHLLGEYFVPANYYEKDFRDEAMFLRADLTLTF